MESMVELVLIMSATVGVVVLIDLFTKKGRSIPILREDKVAEKAGQILRMHARREQERLDKAIASDTPVEDVTDILNARDRRR